MARTQTRRDLAIEIPDLREFRREVRAAGPDAQNALKDANQQVGQRIVDEAQRRAATVGRQAARAAESMRAYRAQATVAVRLGSNGIRFALGAEFGARHYAQFPEWRGASTGAGYFLWPTIRSLRDEISATYLSLIEEAVRPAFPSGR